MNSTDKTKITFNIPNTHSKIVLEVCDILKQQGPKVIHCHHTFDTDLEVVREYSVLGQFIKLCKDKNYEVDSKIDGWIEKNKKKSVVVDDLPCRKNVFNLGELCPLSVDNDVYLLTSFDDLKLFLETGAMDMDLYLEFLDNLWMSLGKMGIEKKEINIPAFGNKIVNVANNGFTIEQKIGLIVQSYFKALKNSRMFETLRICIHDYDAEHIDLSKWENVLLSYLYQFSQLPLGLMTLGAKQKGLYAGITTSLNYYSSNNDADSGCQEKSVFISHSAKDLKVALKVYEFLKKKGFKCWMDKNDITPGLPYAEEIMRGFNNSNFVVVIISKNTMNSVGVINEIDNVYKKNKTIIPFRVDKTELSAPLSFYLSSTQWINAFPKFEEHLDELEEALNQLLKKTTK